MELVTDRTQPIEFTHNGRALKARPMPLKLALKLGEPAEDGSINLSVELMAAVIAECVLFADDGVAVYSAEDILNNDASAMLPLFKAVTELFDVGAAEKN